MSNRGQFHQYSTCSFYKRRSRKCKKDWQLASVFALLGSGMKLISDKSRKLDFRIQFGQNFGFYIRNTQKWCFSTLKALQPTAPVEKHWYNSYYDQQKKIYLEKSDNCCLFSSLLNDSITPRKETCMRNVIWLSACIYFSGYLKLKEYGFSTFWSYFWNAWVFCLI